MATALHQTIGSSDSADDSNGARKRRRIDANTTTSPLTNFESENAAGDIEADSMPSLEESPPIEPSMSRVARTKRKDRSRSHINNVDIKPFTDAEFSNGKLVDKKSSFGTVEVAPWLLVSLAAMEIKRPTAIQKACIPEILAGKDVIGGSKTGSGKTVAFAVPMLQKLAEDPCGIFGLVLTPTRELALQIYEQFMAISSRFELKAALITGGTEMRQQAIALSKRPHIVIATPGRLADHIRTSGIDTVIGLRKVKILVLDEADRLLAKEAKMEPDVQTCLNALSPPEDRQTCLFTATMTQEVREVKNLPRTKGRPPISVCEVDLGEQMAVPDKLHLTYLTIPVTYREAYLHVLLQTPRSKEHKSIIVFVNRTRTTNLLERLLRGLDHRVTSLHSKLPQSERTSNLARFRANAAKILIATDVASRGLDIPEVGLVINYGVPENPDDYIHRVGRTARAGRAGEAVTLVGQRDIDRVLAIEGRIGRKMVEYEEVGVNVETRVVRDALKDVGEKKREVIIGIEEGRDIKGNRTTGRIRRLE